MTIENHGSEKRFVRLAGSVLPSGLSLAVLVALLGTAGGLALLHPVSALAAAGAAALLAGWMTIGLFRAASLVTMLTQYVMVTRPGCSTAEPQTVHAVRPAAKAAVHPAEPAAAFAVDALPPTAPEQEKEDVLAA